MGENVFNLAYSQIFKVTLLSEASEALEAFLIRALPLKSQCTFLDVPHVDGHETISSEIS